MTDKSTPTEQSEKMIQRANTIINHAFIRASGEKDANADIAEIETNFIRGATLKIEDTEGVIRTYAFSDPIFFWIVDAILEDQTRVPISASEQPDDMGWIAKWAHTTANSVDVGRDIPLIDRTKGGRA